MHLARYLRLLTSFVLRLMWVMMSIEIRNIAYFQFYADIAPRDLLSPF